jgi:hypothetical protein
MFPVANNNFLLCLCNTGVNASQLGHCEVAPSRYNQAVDVAAWRANPDVDSWKAFFSIAIVVVVVKILSAAPGFAQEHAEPNPPFLSIEQHPFIFSAPEADATEPTMEWRWHKSSDSHHPDNNEQYLLYLMNRARANPAAEGYWLATADDPAFAHARSYFNVDTDLLQQEFNRLDVKPPAAFDIRLYNAANEHCDDLISRDAQDHTNQIGRVQASGFVFYQYRGNVFSYASSALNAHAGFNIDWGYGEGGMQEGRGHRKAIMSTDGDYTNVGLAAVPETNPATTVGSLVVTGNYCYAGNAADHHNRFLVGTVWIDENDDSSFNPGEGVSGVTVTPNRGLFYAVTANSGGYAIPITEAGTYTVTFSGVKMRTEVRCISVGDGSVLQDVMADPPLSVHGPVLPGILILLLE